MVDREIVYLQVSLDFPPQMHMPSRNLEVLGIQAGSPVEVE